MESAKVEQDTGRIILASQSKARLGLLRESGMRVHSCPVDLDEAVLRDAARAEKQGHDRIALALAHAKALGFFRNHVFTSADFVIAADQILECDGVGFDKPCTLSEARNQLRTLRGRTHCLQTALVLYRDGVPLWEWLETPRLTMRHFSEAFLDDYIAAEGEALLSCVGAYRLEGVGVQLFDSIEGHYDAVLGLPRLPLLARLREYGALKK